MSVSAAGMFTNLWTSGALTNTEICKCYQRLICFVAMTLASRAEGGSAKTIPMLEALGIAKYRE